MNTNTQRKPFQILTNKFNNRQYMITMRFEKTKNWRKQKNIEQQNQNNQIRNIQISKNVFKNKSDSWIITFIYCPILCRNANYAIKFGCARKRKICDTLQQKLKIIILRWQQLKYLSVFAFQNRILYWNANENQTKNMCAAQNICFETFFLNLI